MKMLLLVFVGLLSACSAPANPPANTNQTAPKADAIAATPAQPTPEPMPMTKAELLKIYQSLVRLEQQGRAMEPLRNSSKIEHCVKLMRQYNPQVKAIRAEIDRIPQNQRSLALSYLGGAAASLSVCVTCVKDDLEFCNQAKESLREAEKYIRKMK